MSERSELTIGQGATLERCFFARSVLDVAPDLLGRVVVHTDASGTVAVRLTEVEAYAGAEDPGSHAARGPTPRTQVMFGPPGRAYVYFSYGVHWCANLVTGPAGLASAVLLRAGEVVGGVDLARARRTSSRRDRDLARGPARLAAALGLSGAASGADLCLPGSALRVLAAPGAAPGTRVRTGPRVGVSGRGGGAGSFPWRFWLDDEPSVSSYRAAVVRRRPAGWGGGTRGGGST